MCRRDVCRAVCHNVPFTAGECTSTTTTTTPSTTTTPLACALACGVTYAPVCGVNGVTYNNACRAVCNNVTFTAGECTTTTSTTTSTTTTTTRTPSVCESNVSG